MARSPGGARAGTPPARRRKAGGRPQPALPPGLPETLSVEIEALGLGGDGLARWGAQRVFVPGTLPGDRVIVRPRAPRQGGLAAEVIQILARSPDHHAPWCPAFGRCGGCTLQHLGPAATAAFKHQVLAGSLARAGLGAVPVAETVGFGHAQRRRVQFAVAPGPGAPRPALNAAFGQGLVPLEACPVLEPALQALVAPLSGLCARLRPERVMLQQAGGAVDLILWRQTGPDLAETRAAVGWAEAQGIGRLCWQVAGEGAPLPLYAPAPPRLAAGPLQIDVPPAAFLQASAAAEAWLARAVQQATADLAAGARVFDLYCGLGVLSAGLLPRLSVTFCDVDGAATAALDTALRAVHPPLPARVLTRDLAREPLHPQELAEAAAVILDPPRAGAAAQVAQLVALTQPRRAPGVVGAWRRAPAEPRQLPRVILVSCAPGTLARDAAALVGAGWRPWLAVPLDQFEATAHVEAVMVLDPPAPAP